MYKNNNKMQNGGCNSNTEKKYSYCNMECKWDLEDRSFEKLNEMFDRMWYTDGCCARDETKGCFYKHQQLR